MKPTLPAVSARVVAQPLMAKHAMTKVQDCALKTWVILQREAQLEEALAAQPVVAVVVVAATILTARNVTIVETTMVMV
jgi:hypothetical protein